MKTSFQGPSNQKYITAAQSPYAINCADDIIYCDTSTGPIELYLPNIQGSGLLFTPKKFYVNDSGNNAGTNAITLYPTGSNAVNGGASLTLNTNGISSECVIVSSIEWLINRDTAFAGAIWGSITGNINNQSDLQAEFAAKQNLLRYYAESSNAPNLGNTNAGTYSVLIGDGNTNDAPSIGNFVLGSSNGIVNSIYVTINSLNNTVNAGNEVGIYTISSTYDTVSYAGFLGRNLSYQNASNVYGFGQGLSNIGFNGNILIGYSLVASANNAIEIGPDDNRKMVMRTNGSVTLGTSNDIIFSISGATAVAGTAGAGYGEYGAQASAPTNPAGAGFRMYAGSTGALSWIRNDGGSDTYIRTLDGTLSANRTYTLPDASGTIALTSALGNYFAQSGNAFGTTAVLGTTDNNDLAFKANNTIWASLSANGAFNLFGGNGWASTLGIRQRSWGYTNIIDIYNYDQSKAYLRAVDNGSAGFMLIGNSVIGLDTYLGTVGIGANTSATTRLQVRGTGSGDIMAVVPSGGTGGHYFSNDISYQPYYYIQDASSVTKVLISSANDSTLSGGGLILNKAGGSAFYGIVAQSSAPGNPSTAGLRMYAGSTGAFSWVRNDGVSDTFTRTLDGTLSANRTYTLPNVSGNLQVNNITTSSAGTLNLGVQGTYVFTGSSGTTWTLPAVSGNTNLFYMIKNRGSASITLNSDTGSTIYTTSAAGSITINPGEAYIIQNDGTYYLVM